MQLRSRWLAAAACALIAACSSPGPLSPPAPPFELSARVAVRAQDRAFSSGLRWKQASGTDEIWFNAPLGQTIAYVYADANGATLTAADQQQYRARSIENLTRQALGWPFPVAAMRHWVLGVTAPHLPVSATQRDEAQRLTRFTQGEWEIAFNYATPDAARPSRLDVSGSGVDIRLAIDGLTPAPQ